ncbi:M20/M25/M40 family metallo-hydrolase [uncultured Thermanaerothrix sp.]|uniref:M20 family metallopeptidase n=1 Tax=uncultured Thermanaerothrix sp. TaxID=1195149 RepID=UPI0026111FC3|nr:M20/M25/M40 family metallo-hydrolase [uncultured Thermanaerothrix sp.]
MSPVLPLEVATGEALRLLVDLVRIPAPSGGERAAADFVQAQMQRLGFEAVRRDLYGNVIGDWRGESSGPTLLLEAHMDVVPPGDEQDWRCPPYAGEVSAGRVWGRGAADTHASLAAMLAAVASLPRSELRGRVVLAATVMEESLTAGAVEGLVVTERPEVFITGEPTALRLGVAQKGRATLEIRTTGRAAHTSHPEQGINAITRMMQVLARIAGLPRRWDEDLGSEVFEVTDIISHPYPNINVVPPECQVHLVARLLPDETPLSLQTRLTRAMVGLEGVKIALARLRQTCYTGYVLEREDFLVGWKLPAEHAWRVRLLEALRSQGLPAETLAAGFGSNASAAAAAGVPCFIYGPGDLAQAHTVDEWVAIESVEQAVVGYRTLIQACLGLP